MQFKRTDSTRCDRRRRVGGFTLAEVLAALLFMAIVVPVAMHAVQISSRAGLSGARRDTAARIAERVMSELVATGENLVSSRSGRVTENDAEFEWSLRSRSWSEDDLDLVTVTVAYEVQGRESEVRLSTLYDSSTQIALTIQ